ncbi:hypothetical protein HY087_02870 [Candidatus Gottesmanbacteria bacterium]|nr:hypothetical protein [Candidatus Gottesmanbacteria bacterium]
MADIPGKPRGAEVVRGTPVFDGLFDPGTGTTIAAYVVPKVEPLMPITDETLEARTQAFRSLVIEKDGEGKYATPVTGQMLVLMFGQDVIQAAVDEGFIHVG